MTVPVISSWAFLPSTFFVCFLVLGTQSGRVRRGAPAKDSRPTWRERRAPALWRRGEVQFERSTKSRAVAAEMSLLATRRTSNAGKPRRARDPSARRN
jgi:hypothetical protein